MTRNKTICFDTFVNFFVQINTSWLFILYQSFISGKQMSKWEELFSYVEICVWRQFVILLRLRMTTWSLWPNILRSYPPSAPGFNTVCLPYPSGDAPTKIRPRNGCDFLWKNSLFPLIARRTDRVNEYEEQNLCPRLSCREIIVLHLNKTLKLYKAEDNPVQLLKLSYSFWPQ